MQIEEIIKLEEFKELNCGRWQGLTKDQLKGSTQSRYIIFA